MTTLDEFSLNLKITDAEETISHLKANPTGAAYTDDVVQKHGWRWQMALRASDSKHKPEHVAFQVHFLADRRDNQTTSALSWSSVMLTAIVDSHCVFKDTVQCNFKHMASQITRWTVEFESNRLFPGSVVTLKAHVLLGAQSSEVASTAAAHNMHDVRTRIIDEFLQFTVAPKLCTIIAAADREERYVPRFVLERFQAFQKPSGSTLGRNSVTVPGISGPVLDALILWMVTDDVSSISFESPVQLAIPGYPVNGQLVEGLLYAAHYFELYGLREICIRKLRQARTMNYSVLQLADLVGSPELKQHSLEFIRRNSDYVMQTPWWRELRSNRTSGLADEVFMFLATQSKNSYL